MSMEEDFSLISHLMIIDDPRIDRTKKHELIDILVIAICASICGAETWTEIEDFGEEKESWFKEFLNLKHGIPSHDTFRRLFMILDPLIFSEVFYNWVSSVNKLLMKNDHICIDGKTLRRSFDEAKKTSAIHMVNAWSTGISLSLGQMKSEGKKNEIKTIPKLLDLLSVKGCLVSIDAMGCQKNIAEKILSKGGDYLLALKSNHKYLEERVVEAFEQSRKPGRKTFNVEDFEDKNEGHGRIEKRVCRVITAKNEEKMKVNVLTKWPEINAIIEMHSTRIIKKTGEVSEQTRYFISSSKKNAEEFFKAIRGHWEIENKLHWSLDVILREDECRSRAGNSAENFSLLRHFALNLVKSEETKISVRRKQKKAGWGEEFLLKILLNDGKSKN
jgi:predicted transposase YbfD/YdcC